MNLRKAVRALQAREIRAALRRARGNVAKAAKDLGVPRTYLYELGQMLGIKVGKR